MVTTRPQAWSLSLEAAEARIDDLRVDPEYLGEFFDHHVEDEFAQFFLVLGPCEQRPSEQHYPGSRGRLPRIAGIRGTTDDAGQRYAVLADGVEVGNLLDRELHIGKLGLPARLKPRDGFKDEVVELLGPAPVERNSGRDQPAAQPPPMAVTPPRPGAGGWPGSAVLASLHSYRAYPMAPAQGTPEKTRSNTRKARHENGAGVRVMALPPLGG